MALSIARKAVLLFVLILTGWRSAGMAQTVVVEDDLQGWLIGPFGTAPTTGFVTGPDVPPLGTGSYSAAITVASSKIILGRNDYHDQPLANLTAFSYWTFIDVTATNTNNWYVNLYVDRDGNGTYDHRLDYIPPSGSVVAGLWQQWDAFAGTWRDSSTAMNTTLAAFLGANPNARLNAFNDPNALAVRFNMGDTASTYVGFDGNLDGIRIALTGVGDTTWDFEPPTADLTITKTDGAAAVTAGSPVTYTIVAANQGPSDVTGVMVEDTFPAELQNCSWTCAPAGGATCAAGPVAGDLADTIDLPAGGSATYTAQCTVAPNAVGPLVNTASLTAPAGVTDPDNGDNGATDTDVIMAVAPSEIPTLSPATLAGLAALLIAAGLAVLRRGA